MSSILGLGEISLTILFPIINSFIYVGLNFIYKILKINQHPLISTFFTFLFLIPSCIPMIISDKKKNEILEKEKLNAKRKKRGIETIGDYIDGEAYVEIEEEAETFSTNQRLNLKIKGGYVKVIIVSFLIYIKLIIVFYLRGVRNIEYEKDRNLWIFIFIFITLFAKYELKQKIFNHQEISLIAITGIGIVLNLYYIINNITNISNLVLCFIEFYVDLISSYYFVSLSSIMVKQEICPYRIILCIGMFGSVLSLVSVILSSMIKCINLPNYEPFIYNICTNKDNEKYFDSAFSYFEEIKNIIIGKTNLKYHWTFQILIFLSFFILCFCYFLLNIFTIKTLQPCSTLLTFNLVHFIFTVIDIISNTINHKIDKIKIFFYCIFFLSDILIIFWTLIYNECLEIKVKGLNVNTKKSMKNKINLSLSSFRADSTSSFTLEEGETSFVSDRYSKIEDVKENELEVDIGSGEL